MQDGIFTVDGENDGGFCLVVDVQSSVPGHAAVLGAIVFLLRSHHQSRECSHTPASARFLYSAIQRVGFALPVPSTFSRQEMIELSSFV